MASQSHIFNLSGPLYLNYIDWRNTNHRRSIAASLVQGVYVLEGDRVQGRCNGYNALAYPWWDYVQFKLNHVLVDDKDKSIYGAIYEFKFPIYYYNPLGQNPPRYVIAFRGTVCKPDTRYQDLKLDIQWVFNTLHESSRFQVAFQTILNIVSRVGPKDVWLAGHSLGSAIALLVGRYMVKTGYYLETYLFNPPFISFPIELIKSDKWKQRAQVVSSVVKARFADVIKGRSCELKQDDAFVVLANWTPYLFLNPSDFICAEYIGYFNHREYMFNRGEGEIERLATQNSFRSLFSELLGRESEPSHLLPSAYLIINSSPTPDMKQAHGVEQWWNPNFLLEIKLHQCK